MLATQLFPTILAATTTSSAATPLHLALSTQINGRISSVRCDHSGAADALALPFRDGAFACVMSAFLLRNLEDLERGFREMRRVARPGGLVIALDIVRPEALVWGSLFGVYFGKVVPAIGALVARDRQAYTYLPQSVGRFATPAELVRLMEKVGLLDVRYRRLAREEGMLTLREAGLRRVIEGVTTVDEMLRVTSE